MDLSIIIPAYNEAERLPPTLQAIATYLATKSDWTVELIVVDDGSGDATAEVASASPWPVRLIRHPRNLGKGAAIRTGMLAAQGEWRYMCDADLSTPIAELDLFLTHQAEADIIIGSRRLKQSVISRHQPRWKEVLGQVGNTAIQWLAVPGIQDTQCGFKLFHQRTMGVFSAQRSNRFGYDFEVLFLARKSGWRIMEIPVTWNNDSRTSVRFADYPITLLELLSLRWNYWRGQYHLKHKSRSTT